MKTIKLKRNKPRQINLRIQEETYQILKKASVDSGEAIGTVAGKVLDEVIKEIKFEK